MKPYPKRISARKNMYSCLVNAELFQAGEREENRALARIYRAGKTRRRGTFRDWLMVVGLFALIAVVAAFLGGSEPLQGRARVVDGDSLEINGERVRLQGIDAPEYRQTCSNSGAEIACGRQARDHLRQLVGGREVECLPFGTDRYDRTLAECSAGGISLNETMVRDGWAVAFGNHHLLEAEARREKRGMWAFRFEEPSDWRKDHVGDPVQPGSSSNGLRLQLRRMFANLLDWLKSLI